MPGLNWDALVQKNEALGSKTFYRIGGDAEYFADVKSREALEILLVGAKSRNLSWRVMGSGTNLVIQSEPLPGLTLRLSRKHFDQIVQKDDLFEVGASALYPSLVRQAVEAGFSSAASLGGIPGTVGGALVMNAGGHHGEIGDFIVDVSGFDEVGQFRTWSKEECGFAYRHSELTHKILLSCRLDFGRAQSEGAKEKLSDWVKWKTDTQPTGTRSAGCIFKNPEGHSAGRLIDLCGFKGQRRGDIEVSPKHANFLLNHGQGSFEDLISLIKEIKEKVYSEHGVVLEEEVEIWQG